MAIMPGVFDFAASTVRFESQDFQKICEIMEKKEKKEKGRKKEKKK